MTESFFVTKAIFFPYGIEYAKEYIKDRIIIDENSCWNWKNSLSKMGYGIICIQVKNVSSRFLAHRYSFSAFNNDPIKNQEIDHLCRNRKCVNPDHLRTCTRSENSMNRVVKQYEKCKKGHLLTSENVYLCKDKRYIGKVNRQCIICKKLSCREYYLRTTSKDKL